ncbi:unnamed protein product, partial [Phaeothamnion confervicola]
ADEAVAAAEAAVLLWALLGRALASSESASGQARVNPFGTAAEHLQAPMAAEEAAEVLDICISALGSIGLPVLASKDHCGGVSATNAVAPAVRAEAAVAAAAAAATENAPVPQK